MGIVKKTDKENKTEWTKRKYTRDCDGFKEQLKDPDPSVRRWAAKDIVECEGASEVLINQLKDEEIKEVREAIITSLINIGDNTAVKGLIDCLRSEDAALRNEAIEAMKEMPDQVAPIIRDLLNDNDPDIRIFAVNILESLKHPEVEQWLIEVIESDPHINVCATAADLLAEVGTERAVEPLKNLKNRFSAEPYIGFVVDIALERIQNG